LLLCLSGGVSGVNAWAITFKLGSGVKTELISITHEVEGRGEKQKSNAINILLCLCANKQSISNETPEYLKSCRQK